MLKNLVRGVRRRFLNPNLKEAKTDNLDKVAIHMKLNEILRDLKKG